MKSIFNRLFLNFLLIFSFTEVYGVENRFHLLQPTLETEPAKSALQTQGESENYITRKGSVTMAISELRKAHSFAREALASSNE